ncbi:MAG TPA: WD40 repeat domain-containing protein [Polyangia bacterium]|nr:WD40 repeat domain-containing protein [Polyangia bacterium]
MRARIWGAAAIAALIAGAGFAGCKQKESLVVVTLTAATADTTLRSASIGVGSHAETFTLSAGVPSGGVSFGVYVPSSITGLQTISVVVSPATAGDCNGLTGNGSVDIKTAGETDGPIDIGLTASTTACPMGGSSGTGGRVGTGGTGTGGTGTGGKGTGGTGIGGSAGGSPGGHAGGTALGGSSGGTGTGGATGGTGGGGGGHALSTCTEVDHASTGNCAAGLSTCNDVAVWGVAFSPTDPTLFVTGGSDARVKRWTITNGVAQAPSQAVLSGAASLGLVAFSPDGTLLAIGRTGGVDIVSVATWTVQRTLTITNQAFGVAFSPDGQQVITLDSDGLGTARLYVHAVNNIAALSSVSVPEGYALAVSRTAVNGGLPVAVTTDTGSLIVFTLTSSGFSVPTTLTVTSDGSYAETVAIAPGGGLVAAGGDDGIMHFWTLPSLTAQSPTIDINASTAGSTVEVYASAFSDDGSTLAIGGGYAASVTAWAVAPPRPRLGQEWDSPTSLEIDSMAFSPDGKVLVVGEADCGCVAVCPTH